MSRGSAIAMLVDARQHLVKQRDEHPASGDEARRLQGMVDDLTRLLLDVRAGRVHEFEITAPTRLRITVSDR